MFAKALFFVNKATHVFSLPFTLGKIFGHLCVHAFYGWLWFWAVLL